MGKIATKGLAAALTSACLAAACATPAGARLPVLVRPPPPPSPAATETLVASWYGKKFDGRPTASGAPFDSSKLTAAHRSLAFGTRLRVRNPRNDTSVVVTVTDRGPWEKNRDLDLSLAAARRLGIVSKGLAEVEVEVLESGRDRRTRPVTSME